MSRIIILSPYEIKKFDNAPLFNDEERHKFFNISASFSNLAANENINVDELLNFNIA